MLIPQKAELRAALSLNQTRLLIHINCQDGAHPQTLFSADFVTCLSAGLRPNDLTSVGHGEWRGSRRVTGLMASYPSNPSKQPQKQHRMGCEGGPRSAVTVRRGAFSPRKIKRNAQTKATLRRRERFFLFRARNKTVVKFLIKK